MQLLALRLHKMNATRVFILLTNLSIFKVPFGFIFCLLWMSELKPDLYINFPNTVLYIQCIYNPIVRVKFRFIYTCPSEYDSIHKLHVGVQIVTLNLMYNTPFYINLVILYRYTIHDPTLGLAAALGQGYQTRLLL